MNPSTSNTMKTDLIAFLANEEPKYTSLKVRLVSMEPLKVSEDGAYFVESLSMARLFEGAPDLDKVTGVELTDWNFVLKKVPGSHGYYFDFEVRDYQLLRQENLQISEQEASKMNNIMDDKEIRFKFEVRKRGEISKLYRQDKKKESVGKSKGKGKQASKGSKFSSENEVRILSIFLTFRTL